MGLIDRLCRAATPTFPGDALYRAVVAAARRPRWYTDGGVPDSVDGRFDMVVLILSIVLLRLEREGEKDLNVHVTERFVADMDGSLREIGIGDMVVGKHVGKLVGALGGRLGAYRDALAPGADPALLGAALTRNLYRGVAPSPEALAWVEREARALAARIDAQPLADLVEGRVAEEA